MLILCILMADFLGRIAVPQPVDSGATFPLVCDMGYGLTQDLPIVVHQFGSRDAKTEQRFQVGLGPRKHSFRRQNLSQPNRNQLAAFWEARKGPWESFLYNAPAADLSTSPVKVTFAYEPISFEYLVNACRVGLNFLEVPDPSAAPSYAIDSTCLRFPSTALKSALLSQVQQIIPLVHIRPREVGQTQIPDNIYLSDRRCTVGGQLYQPRLENIGEPGSDVLISQDIYGTADNVQFTFGNADRAMTQLSNDTDLKFATVELSLYHVNSGILLQLWKGFLINFTADGSPNFTIQCSDGLYQVTQQYPQRSVTRTCWKTFNDGVNCPYSSVGSGGNPSKCDYYLDSADGCQSHGMDPYFGGHPAQPQGVNLKDNSTGTWGFGRNQVTATSIVSDTIWGKALQEIWCNDDDDPGKSMPVNCMIAALRDESDFVDALGIVGAGPIGQFTGMLVYTNADGFKYVIAPMLDGQTPHGFKVDGQLNIISNAPLGLREISGVDPQSDSFSLGQGTPQVWGPQRAAGTAFVEIRRADDPGIQPSLPESHSMQVPISKGLSGWTWDSSGVRTLTDGLTNWAWIAVNSLLRALGLFGASSAAQKDMFVLPSLIVGDGSGTAEIADDTVDKLVGAGTETQFRFQGVIGQKKPFRDWLNEICSTGLGFYTWEFGKLKLGCRINASAVEAFTVGNILFQSLRLEPIEAAFERVVIDFADRDYAYQANIAEYEDKDHAAYYGRSGSPLESPMHSVGIASLSQGLRIAAVRTREEIGGINADEWKAARNASWKTTVLALNTEVGQVDSLTHDDVPGGSGKFRIISWKFLKDWSIDIQAKTVTDSMYDLTVGPKPADVVPDPLPPLFFPIPFAPAWAPYQIQAPSNDALFPNEWTFDSDQEYTPLKDLGAEAAVVVTGKFPVNDFIPGCGAPVIGSIAQSATGGNIPGDTSWRVTICADDANGLPSPPALIAIVHIPAGTNTNKITLDDIVWPAIAGLAGFTVFASDVDARICGQQTGSLTDDGTHLYTPGSIDILGPFARSTYALPSPFVSKVRIRAKRLSHSGIVGIPVAAVASTNQISHPGLIDVSSSPLDYAGRIVSVIGRNGSPTPFISFRISAFDPATGTITTATPSVGGAPETSILVGDVIVIRFLGYDNSATPTEFTDVGLLNPVSPTPFSGLTVDAERGNVWRVIQGLGRGQLRKITGNTPTKITWDTPLVMDATSVGIIETAGYPYLADATVLKNADPLRSVSLSVPTANFSEQPILVAAFTVDINGTESPDGDNPVREDWVFGDPGALGDLVNYQKAYL